MCVCVCVCASMQNFLQRCSLSNTFMFMTLLVGEETGQRPTRRWLTTLFVTSLFDNLEKHSCTSSPQCASTCKSQIRKHPGYYIASHFKLTNQACMRHIGQSCWLKLTEDLQHSCNEDNLTSVSHVRLGCKMASNSTKEPLKSGLPLVYVCSSKLE